MKMSKKFLAVLSAGAIMTSMAVLLSRLGRVPPPTRSSAVSATATPTA